MANFTGPGRFPLDPLGVENRGGASPPLQKKTLNPHAYAKQSPSSFTKPERRENPLQNPIGLRYPFFLLRITCYALLNRAAVGRRRARAVARRALLVVVVTTD